MALLAAAGRMAVQPATAARASALTLEPLAGRLALVRGGAANILVASAGGELVLVDGGAARDAKSLQKLLDRHYPGQRLRALFNTHWHAAQTGFNATARRMGADVIAHENTRLWLGTEVHSRWEGMVYAPQPAFSLPNKTFHYGEQSLDFGGAKIQYGHLGQAHTDGDIYVRFAEENVLVAGDVLSPVKYPVVDPASNGWLGGMYSALKILVGMSDAATRLVPGTAAIADLPALRQQQEMCFTVLSRIGDSYFKGQTYPELLASAPTREFDAQFGNPAQFLQQVYDTAWYHVNEIRRVVR
jgi:glyoxylase-like metal-dependent hydrolase (beta-lactamase superfamily II)